jgi:hypothetical protein
VSEGLGTAISTSAEMTTGRLSGTVATPMAVRARLPASVPYRSTMSSEGGFITGAASLAGLPGEGDARQQLRHVWNQWLRCAMANPEKRRALALLQICDEITAESHRAAREAQRLVAGVFERSWANGPMSDAPVRFALTLTNAIAEAAIDAITRDPANAETHGGIAFEAIWRVLPGTPEHSNDSPYRKDTI